MGKGSCLRETTTKRRSQRRSVPAFLDRGIFFVRVFGRYGLRCTASVRDTRPRASLTVRLTLPLKPLRGSTETPVATLLPCGKERLSAEAERAGIGVIWNGDPLEPPVIPAKAGIQSDDSTFPKVCGVHSRFRGNDQVSQMTPVPKGEVT